MTCASKMKLKRLFLNLLMDSDIHVFDQKVQQSLKMAAKEVVCQCPGLKFYNTMDDTMQLDINRKQSTV